jgi:hypothetical protein
MRTTNFYRGIIKPIAHLLGIDPALDLNKDHVAAWTSMINDCINNGFGYWQWPQLEVVEERAFRTIWNAARQFQLNDELFYIPDLTYYRAIATPPVGTLPTDPTYFTSFDVANRYIAYDQPGKRPIDQAIGVYHGDPFTNCMNGIKFWPSPNGIQLNGYGGPTAFLKFKINPPQFSAEAWDASASYAKNDLVYFNDTGECYQAKTANVGHSPNEGAYWRKQEMPEFLAPYVRYQVAADASDDAVASGKWAGSAEDAVIAEVNKLLEQGQELRYHIRRPYCHPRMWPLGVSGFFWSISPPWTASTVTTLTDEDDPFSEEINTMLEDGVTQIGNGNSYVDVDFQSWTGGSGYSFDELLVQNFVDSPPLGIFPTVLVDKRADGFRYLLSAPPDNNNYFLKWRIVP